MTMTLQDDDGTPDWVLLERWQAGDDPAGTLLLQRYMGPLSRFFNSKIDDPNDVPDLVADTMLACTHRRHAIRESKSFRSYLFGIASNRLRHHYNKQNKRRLEQADFEQVCVGEADDDTAASRRLMRKHETNLVIQALRALPLSYQIVLELSMFEDMTGRAIGELLGVPTATVHTRLRRGKEQLCSIVERLSQEPEQWHSTVTDLEGWAARLQAQFELDAQRSTR